ncbi:hypothetical protein SAMN05443254_101265 [Bradyrhizobium sp. OK095]|nr:hypothetical protein SAMN05443254_101265 [Bradyrhizobium sp. OK095]
MSEATVLVSGATGRTGGAAVDELLKMGRMSARGSCSNTRPP